MKRVCCITFAIAILFAACYYKPDDFIFDESTDSYQLNDYYIDENGNEGIVCANGTDGFFKFLMVISADESYQVWGPIDYDIYPYDSINTNIINSANFGIIMLQSMKSIGIERFPAQAWCDSKNKGDGLPYGGSWHLPTVREFEIVTHATKIEYINQALENIGATPIDTSSFYWTCVEDFPGYITLNGDSDIINNDPENRAIPLSPMLNIYTNRDRWIKQNKHHVRAVKYVYYKTNK